MSVTSGIIGAAALPNFIVKKKWDLAALDAFPGSVPANIVMTPESVREDQEKLRRAIEEKRKEEMQDKRQSQADALRAMASQQNNAIRQQYQQQQYGVSSFPFAATSMAYSSPLGGIQFNPYSGAPEKPAPAVPEKTTEEAQEELTGLGRRKIITGDDK